MKSMSDFKLMKLVNDKNVKALEELYDRYIRLIYSFAIKSTKDDTKARVIVQAVFTRLWTTEKGYDESKGAFPNWLLTITRNCIIDEGRKEQKHQDNIQLNSGEWERMINNTDEYDPEKAVLHQASKGQLQQAFKRLSNKQVQLLQLLYWEGYSLKEIAELKNEPLGTVKSRLHQSLKTLRHHMVFEGRNN
jgi:RNA polymerase sigma-70 factor (ECF subfamily)